MSPDVQTRRIKTRKERAAARNSAGLILSVATELFAANGFQGTSITDVCTATGVSRPVIYYFYGSKEGLYRAVIENAYEHFNRLLKSADDIATPTPKWLALARLLLDDATQSPLMWRLLLSAIWTAAAPSTDDIRLLHEKLAQTLISEPAKRVRSKAVDSSRQDAAAYILAGGVSFVVARYLNTGQPDLKCGAARNLLVKMFDMERVNFTASTTAKTPD